MCHSIFLLSLYQCSNLKLFLNFEAKVSSESLLLVLFLRIVETCNVRLLLLLQCSSLSFSEVVICRGDKVEN